MNMLKRSVNSESSHNTSKVSAVMAIALITLLVVSRIIPHPWNFTAMGATGLFAGFYSGSGVSRFEKWAFWSVPFVGLFLSDCLLGFHQTMIYTYFGLAASVILGLYVGSNKDWPKSLEWGGQTFISTTLFFAVTNFGVWFTGGMYPLNFTGLMESYVAGIPFYGYQLVGDLFYMSLIVAVCIYFQIPQRRLSIRQNEKSQTVVA